VGRFDSTLTKWFSRKLFVYLTATGLLFYGNLTSEDWTAIALVYIGSQAAVDLAARWRHGK
tara:strand:+ start:274 stop:456 length:183 start_codon:yes stop_codon:yes gene_type:complete